MSFIKSYGGTAQAGEREEERGKGEQNLITKITKIRDGILSLIVGFRGIRAFIVRSI